MIVQSAAPGWVDKIETDIINFTLDKLVQEISDVSHDDDDDYSDYTPAGADKDVDVNNMFDADDYDVAQEDKRMVEIEREENRLIREIAKSECDTSLEGEKKSTSEFVILEN